MSGYIVVNRNHVGSSLDIYDSELYARMYSREEVRKAECPTCLAESEDSCTGIKGTPRKSNHINRVHKYHELQTSLTKRKVSTKVEKPRTVELHVKKFTGKIKKKGKNMPVLLKKPTSTKKTLTLKKTKTAPVKKKEVATAAPPAKKKSLPKKKSNLVSTTARVSAKKEQKGSLYAETDKNKKVAGMTFQNLSEVTGMAIDSEQFAVAVEILKGGVTRQDVNHRVRELLPPTTRTGTPKAVSNLVSGVIGKLTARGFIVEGNWKMIFPAP